MIHVNLTSDLLQNLCKLVNSRLSLSGQNWGELLRQKAEFGVEKKCLGRPVECRKFSPHLEMTCEQFIIRGVHHFQVSHSFVLYVIYYCPKCYNYRDSKGIYLVERACFYSAQLLKAEVSLAALPVLS